jgi:hypothetical protein
MEMHKMSAAIMLPTTKMLAVLANEHVVGRTERFSGLRPRVACTFSDIKVLLLHRAGGAPPPFRAAAHPLRQDAVHYGCLSRAAWAAANYDIGLKRKVRYAVLTGLETAKPFHVSRVWSDRVEKLRCC